MSNHHIGLEHHHTPPLSPIIQYTEALNVEDEEKAQKRKIAEEDRQFKWAFFFMKMYIFLNMGYNIGSKYLQTPQEYPDGLQSFSAAEICFSRGVFGVMITYAIIKHNKLTPYSSVPDSQRKWLFIRAFYGIMYFGSYTYCVGSGAISTIFLAQNLTPMISSVLAFFIFKEYLNKLDIISLFVGFGGILLILLPQQNTSSYEKHSIWDLLLILTLPFQLTGLQMFIRLMKNIHYSLINFYYCFVTAMGFLVMTVYYQIEHPSYQKFTSWNILILILSSISHVGAIICYTQAFQKGKAGKVGIIAYSQIIYSMLCDLFIFHIKFSWIQIIGMIIVFAVSLIVALRDKEIALMGNLTSNLNQNIQEFANQLIEQERSKNNSLNQSCDNESQDGDQDNQQMISLKHQIAGAHLRGQHDQLYYPTLTISTKTVRVLVDDGIQFDLDIVNDNLTCGWLISEVTRLYTEYLREKNRLIQQYSKQHPQIQQEKDFHQIIQMSRRQQLNFNKVKEKNQVQKEKQKLIVALKTYDQNESIDHWLTMYDRSLAPLQDGEVLIAHFAKISPNKRKQISVGDFEMIKVIGRGGFSRVLLCRKKDTGRLYAMKILKKSKLIREKKIKPILSERAVLEQLDHPFIVKLHWAFQSKEELFFILDICTGGEIFFHLNSFKRFPEQLAKFYFCEILLGLEYLHEKEIVYRDIKPENILIDIEGHIKIADFGLAKVIPHRTKSFSFCGSPEYMSPEMLKGRGHDQQLDYYCLGALLYEMLTGLPPYYSKDTNQMYIRILNEELSFPDFINKQHPVVDLLIKLLAKDPRQRLSSVDEIKMHSWLSDVNWGAIIRKEITPPFVPSIRESNFDPEFNELPIDFDEMEMKMRLSTERRQSYYIESTVQSRGCTENSFYFNSHQVNHNNQNPGSFTNDHQHLDDSDQQQNLNNNGNQNALFNNFFSNPGDDVKDIYNDSSGTNNTNNSSIQNIKHKANNSSQKQDDQDVFRNFSFYDSPLEENEILTQIKRCCIKIGQLPQHLYSTNPQQQQNLATNSSYQKQLNLNLRKLQTHMQQFGTTSMHSKTKRLTHHKSSTNQSQRLICEEQEEEEEGDTSNSLPKQTLHDQDDDGNPTVIVVEQLHAQPSELSSSSINIEATDIALPMSDQSSNNELMAIMQQQKKNMQSQQQMLDIQEVTKALKNLNNVGLGGSIQIPQSQFNGSDSIYNKKSGYGGGHHQHQLSNDFLMVKRDANLNDLKMDDFTNQMGSFSSKSINTYDESNQSVAQEFKTNESIAMQTYHIANINKQVDPMNGALSVLIPQTQPEQLGKQMQIQEPQQVSSPKNNGGHQYKKSMINPPTMQIMRPSLDLQINFGSNEKPSTYGANGIMVSPTQKKLMDQSPFKSPNNMSTKDIQNPNVMGFIRMNQSPANQKLKHQDHQLTTQQSTTVTINTGATVYKYQTPDNQVNAKKQSFLQESAQMLNRQYQEILKDGPSSSALLLLRNSNPSNPQQELASLAQKSGPAFHQNDEESSPNKRNIQSKRNTAKFRSMDLTSQSLGRLNNILHNKNDIMLSPGLPQVNVVNHQQVMYGGSNAFGLVASKGHMKEWRAGEILSDLKEVSLEGANSISLSPQRSCLPDLTPNPGTKIQTLKRNKIQQTKVTKTLKSKGDGLGLQSPKEFESMVYQSKGLMKQGGGGVGVQTPATSTMIKKARPNNLKLDNQSNNLQGKYSSNGNLAHLQQDGGVPPQKLSSKNSNQKPNLFSEKSSTNLQSIISSPMMQGATVNTPTQTQQTAIPSTIKGKFDFFTSNTHQQIQRELGIYHSSSGSTKVQTPASATLKISLQSPSNIRMTQMAQSSTASAISKKLQEKLESGTSRNDNPKITTSVGAMMVNNHLNAGSGFHTASVSTPGGVKKTTGASGGGVMSSGNSCALTKKLKK